MSRKTEAERLADQVMDEFADSPEVQEFFKRLAEAHGRLEFSDQWAGVTAHSVESTYGYLKMALEAAGYDV